MKSIIAFGGRGMAAFSLPSSAGERGGVSDRIIGRLRLSTESIGAFNLTLQNVVIGSIWQVEVVSVTGVAVASGVATDTNVNVVITVFGPGDPKNSLRIKVRKATEAPYYQPFETQTTAVIGSGNIFVNQVRDDV